MCHLEIADRDDFPRRCDELILSNHELYANNTASIDLYANFRQRNAFRVDSKIVYSAESV